MPTPTPFSAPRGQFIPNISPLGEVNRQVERMKALGVSPKTTASVKGGLTGKLGPGLGYIQAAALGYSLGAPAGEASANYLIQNHPETAKQIKNTILSIPGAKNLFNVNQYPAGTETVKYPK